MEKSTVILEHDARGHAALLTLRRGVSAWGTWAFDPPDAGSSVRVGASSGCDWQIASPGVAPLTLLFTGESLLARCERRDPRVRLNGAPLGGGWCGLDHGDRLELGPSCIEVNLSASLRRIPAEVIPEVVVEARPERRRKPARRYKPRSGPPRVRPAPTPSQDHVPLAALTREVDPTPYLGPALFDDSERSSAQSLGWYAAIGIATLLAYAGWLVLLEHL